VIVVGVFEDAVIKAKGAADFAGKKTGEFVELSKLRISASEIEKKIDSEYLELGKMVYKAAKEHTDCTDYVGEKAAAIDALFVEHAEFTRKISELRNVKKCPQCDHENPPEAEYCTKCGTKL
jgi:ribosomal protein L40E